MRPVCIAILLVALVVGLYTSAQGQNGKDTKSIVGTWRLVSVEMDGEKLQFPADGKSHGTFTPEGKFKIVLDFVDKIDSKSGTFKLKRGQDPAQIDLVFREGKKDYSVLGIYVLEGDRLKLCLGNEESARPTEFKAPKGADVMVNLVFTRGKK